MAAFNPIDDPQKAAEAFDNVFKASLMPAYKLQDFLTPQELAAAKNYNPNAIDYYSNKGTDNQFFNLGALANSKNAGDSVAKIQARLDSATAAELPALLKQYGISQSSWDGYNTNRMALSDQLGRNATDTSIQHLKQYLLKQGVNITSMDQLNALPASQKQQLVNGWLSTVKAERESGGFLSDAMGILGTVAGIATGNPWLGALAGGLSSGISTGSPLAGVLGAAGGYFGASGVADAGGFMNYINNTISSIGNTIMHPIDSLTSALGNITSGFGGGSTAGSGSGAWTGLANSGQSAGDILSGWSPVGSSGGWGSAAGVASTINDAAQTASSAHDVLNGNQVPGGASGNLTPTTGGGLTTAQGAGAVGAGTAGAGGLAALPGASGANGSNIASNISSSGGGLSAIPYGNGTLAGTPAAIGSNATLGTSATALMNSLFGTGGTGAASGLLRGSGGISDSAMNLLAGVFGQMNSSDLAALQDKILKSNQMLTNYLPSTQWRDTLLNHLNTIVTNPGALVSSGPYKDYLDQATNSIERKAVAQGYGGVGQSSNTKNMVAQGLISNMNDIISKDYSTSVNALQPYFQVGAQGSTNLTNYSNSGLPSSVATSDLASILKIAQGATPIASGLLKSIF